MKIKFVTHGTIENIMTVLMVDSRRGFKNDTIKVLVNGEMTYYIDTSKIISIKPITKK